MTKLLLIVLVLSALILNTNETTLRKRRLGVAHPPLLTEISGLKKFPQAQTKGEVFNFIEADMISSLLGSAKACDIYKNIDRLVTESKTRKLPEGIALAQKLAALERGFNNFNDGGKAKPPFCDDPALPSSPEVRCVISLIEPKFPGATEFNAAAIARNEKIQANPVGTPDLCAGKSVLQQAVALGFGGSASGADPSKSTPASDPVPALKEDVLKPADAPKKCKPKSK